MVRLYRSRRYFRRHGTDGISVIAEALSIYGLVRRGLETTDSARELIGIRPEILTTLRACGFHTIIRVRARVLEEFNRLIALENQRGQTHDESP